MKLPINKTITGICILFITNTLLLAQKNTLPFFVDSLYNSNNKQTLDLQFAKGTESFSIFTPDNTQNKYNHGVVLYPFKGMLYAQWQSSAKDEDSHDTQVYYSRSSNGKDWTKPMLLSIPEADNFKTSGGWWNNGDTLIAFISVWPDSIKPRGGFTEYITSTDGLNWSKPKFITDDKGKIVCGLIEQDIRKLPDGRILTAFHKQVGLTATPYYTDNSSGCSGWKAGEMEHLTSKEDGTSREIEPSWFYRKDSAVVMVFRDQQGSFKKLASISFDNGEHWTLPVFIDTPDSRSKQSAGNLPDGTAFMVNNPTGNKNRFPLAITLSKDGYHFDKAYLLRSGGKDMQPQRYEGLHKRVGYSYPKSVLWGDYLYAGYATNKEDVEITRIPIKSLEY